MIQVTDSLIGRVVQAILDEVYPEQLAAWTIDMIAFRELGVYTPCAAEFGCGDVDESAAQIDRRGGLAPVEELVERVWEELEEMEGP